MPDRFAIVWPAGEAGNEAFMQGVLRLFMQAVEADRKRKLSPFRHLFRLPVCQQMRIQAKRQCDTQGT